MNVLNGAHTWVGFVAKGDDELMVARHPSPHAHQNRKRLNAVWIGIERDEPPQPHWHVQHTKLGRMQLRAVKTIDLLPARRFPGHKRNRVVVFERFQRPRGDGLPATGRIDVDLQEKNAWLVFHSEFLVRVAVKKPMCGPCAWTHT